MMKKFLITLTIGLVLLFLIYRASISSSFLIPIDVSKVELQEVFRPEVIEDLKTVYSFGNFKNHISFHDIDNKIRCNAYRLNEYSELPTLDNLMVLDTIEFNSGISESYYGIHPTLYVSSKFFSSYANRPIIKLNNNCNIKSSSSDYYSTIFGEFEFVGLFNDLNECNVLFRFDNKTMAKMVFFKSETSYYIVVYYGINGYEIDKSEKVLKFE
jgi:hypothetical protein